ncbi:MAG: hypothetical protein LN413_00070 [Candidatus Thermoplasmatota archaeon]|nr:hypothetical protein [Candidatus Thermoplasmatota archaeon]
MTSDPITPEIVADIVRRLRALPFGDLTISTHRNRVVGYTTLIREKLTPRGKRSPA